MSLFVLGCFFWGLPIADSPMNALRLGGLTQCGAPPTLTVPTSEASLWVMVVVAEGRNVELVSPSGRVTALQAAAGMQTRVWFGSDAAMSGSWRLHCREPGRAHGDIRLVAKPLTPHQAEAWHAAVAARSQLPASADPWLKGAMALFLFGEEEAGALRHLQQARSWFAAAGTGEEWFAATWFLAHRQKAAGSFDEAHRLLAEAGDRPSKKGEQAFQARVLLTLGEWSFGQGFFSAAEQRFHQAVELRRTLGMRHEEGVALHNLGYVYTFVGDFAAAEQHYGLALNALDGYLPTIRITLMERAWLAHQRGRHRVAARIFQKVLALVREDGNQTLEIGILDRLGTVFRHLGDLQKAETHHRQALDLLLAQDHSGVRQAVVLTNLALLALEQDRFDRAASLCAQAASCFPSQAGADEERAFCKWVHARALDGLGRPDAAHAAFSQCVRLLESLCDRSPNGKMRYAFFEKGFGMLEDFFHHLHRRGLEAPSRGFDRQALALLERVRARGFLRRAASHSGQPAAEPKGGVSDPESVLLNQVATSRQVRIQARPASETRDIVRDLRRRILAPDALYLAYLLGEDQGYWWLVGRQHFASGTLPARRELEEQVDRYLRLLRKPNPLARGQRDQLGRQLTQILLPGLNETMRDKRIYLVPDGLLFELPFVALPSPQSYGAQPSYLIEDHALVYLPSAEVGIQTARAPAQVSRTQRALIMADPVYGRNDTRLKVPVRVQQPELPRLPHTRGEAETCSSVLAPRFQVDLRTGFSATRAQLLAAPLEQYALIHIASHALVSSEHPDQVGLVLSRFDRQGRRLNPWVGGQDLAGVTLRADLVVLSACYSAQGTYYRGEGVVGLGRRFLEQGARSVVAGLWRVEDQVTATLMDRFYTAAFQEGRSRAEALRSAQLALLQDGATREPFFWAGFALFGNAEKF